MYDIVIVGAGITAAAVCAVLKDRYKILVLDIRNHLGGNCYDFEDKGSQIHAYGPHCFHSPSKMIVDFLSKFTEWQPIKYTVEAETEEGTTPFPYSGDLPPEDIIRRYFVGYSQKMWGVSWEQLPKTITNRVPKNNPDYFPGEFVALPLKGYAHMLGNMFDGVELRLKAGADDWKTVAAKKIIYTGRPDHILRGEMLDFRTLAIDLQGTDSFPAMVRNYCHMRVPYTRRVWYRNFTGGASDLFSTETPLQATADDPTPYYPMQFGGNPEKYQRIVEAVKAKYPNLVLAGRLGSYRYLDMYQAVGQGLSIAGKRTGEVVANIQAE